MHESAPTLRDTILALARRYDFEEGHSLQDERLALRLFDETMRVGLHHLGQHPAYDTAIASCSPRDILSSAAILHDIGYVEGYEQHHKTAYRLIMAEPIPGLSPHDQTLIAHVARYHRGGTPDPVKHPGLRRAAHRRPVAGGATRRHHPLRRRAGPQPRERGGRPALCARWQSADRHAAAGSRQRGRALGGSKEGALV